MSTLQDPIADFLYDAIVHACHQAAEMEAAMKLHQERMKDVCESIKAHHVWEAFGHFFPEFDRRCKFCDANVSPEFDWGRHIGLCALKDGLDDEDTDGSTAHESFYPHLYTDSHQLKLSNPN